MAKKSRSYKKINKWAKRNFFKKCMKEDPDFKCVYCGQHDLIIIHEQDPAIPLHRRATIDHVVPVFAGGSRLDRSNWVVACEECNKEKNIEDQQFYGVF